MMELKSLVYAGDETEAGIAPGFFVVDGDPSGVLEAAAASLAVDPSTGAAYAKTSANSTSWATLLQQIANGLEFDEATNILTLGSVAIPGTLRGPDGVNAGGANLTIEAGDGTGSAEDGGNLYLRAGAKVGLATEGSVIIESGPATFTLFGDTDQGLANLTFTANFNSETDVISENMSDGTEACATFTARNNTGKLIDMYMTSDNFSGSWVSNGPTGLQGGMNVGNGVPLLGIAAGNNTGIVCDSSGNVITTFGTRAAGGTNKFLYLPLLTGNQTGTPANLTGNYANGAPCLVQNNGGVYSFRAYINGGWRSVALA